MALADNSYGSVLGVEALVPRYTSPAGHFDSSTRPVLTQVEQWLDQISAILNGYLAQYGFTIPVTNTDAVNLLAMFVNQEVAAMVEGVNGSGRFGPTTKAPGKRGRFAVITEDAEAYIAANAVGLERLGAERTKDALAGLAYRATNEAGEDIAPIFQREAFGNVFKDWDRR